MLSIAALNLNIASVSAGLKGADSYLEIRKLLFDRRRPSPILCILLSILSTHPHTFEGTSIVYLQMVIAAAPAIPSSPLYGDASFKQDHPRTFVSVESLTEEFAGDEGQEVVLRARLDSSRCKGKLGFLVLREGSFTVQGVIDAKSIEGDSGKNMVKFAGQIPLESIIDIEGVVKKAFKYVQSCSHGAVEIQIKKIHSISRAMEQLPFYLKDANQPDTEGDEHINVELQTRLDHRVLDLRTYVTRAIMKVSSETCFLFRDFLRSKSFTEIHSPKLLGGASEGGANCFNLNYFNKSACLAQSPQLYKQMAICGDMDRVFEIGPVFRAENSNTHRHLCEFTGLDMEMTFKEDYMEATHLMIDMFHHIFKGLAITCKAEQDLICQHFNTTPFTFDENKPTIINYVEGMDMLRKAGHDVPEDIMEYDIGTEMEKALGKLVKEAYGTDFYVMTGYPSAIRPFYSMPHPTEKGISNSYDFFMRGEEIVSGAQRVHIPELLEQQAVQKGMKVETIRDYVDSFRLGCAPHAGCGVGLERVVMLFLDVGNIRRVSMFPRDPKRLTP